MFDASALFRGADQVRPAGGGGQGGQPIAGGLGRAGWPLGDEPALGPVLSFVAEPADVDGLKGRRQHAKTDQADAKHLRELVQAGTLPESWIPPVLVREMRAKVRLYKDLLDERGGWRQRIAAVLYHHGAPARPGVRHGERRWLDAEPALSPSGRQAITVAWRMIDALDTELLTLRAESTAFARRQVGCRELQREYGIGPLLSVVVWSELGDTRRFHASHNAVRHTGLDISVYSSDGRRSRGHLTRQGPALLRRSGRITSLTTGSDGNPSDQNPPRALPRSHPAALRAVPP